MLPPDFDKIPPELKALHQWVDWSVEEREGKPTKVPKNPKTGGNAQADNPATWGTYNQALKQYEAHKRNGIAGIGFEFSADDPFTGIDLDKCRDPETGQLKYCAQLAIEHLDSYSEASPSGTGTHTIAKAKWPVKAGNSKTLPCGMKIEVYDILRYFTMTGHHLEGTPTTIEDRQAELTALHTVIFGKPKAPPKDPGPAPDLELSDRELIDKAHQATDGEKFGRLWRGDISEYPTPSHADYALAHKLAFWTNKDPDRLDRLFRQSGLYQDPARQKKWDRLAANTIGKAIANTPEGYNPGKRMKGPQNGPEAGVGKDGSTNKPQDKKPTLKTISAKDLGAKTFAPPRWAVPGLLPEGLIILAGKPKTGKSWLALDVAVSVATGGVALGKIKVDVGEALYLALEDSERRLKERIEKIVPFGNLPETLHFLTAKDFPPLHKGGLEALDNWLNDHPQARLVIIDTLARVKPPRGRNADAYDHDTAIIATLQTITIKHRISLIVVHHTKKLETDDFVEAVSGTFGLTGAADCVAVLVRKSRAAAEAELKITGRDVADIEKAMKFHPDLGTWEILGEATEFASSPERQDILLILKEVGPKTPAQLSKLLNKSDGAIRISLMRMKQKGEIKHNSQTGEYHL